MKNNHVPLTTKLLLNGQQLDKMFGGFLIIANFLLFLIFLKTNLHATITKNDTEIYSPSKVVSRRVTKHSILKHSKGAMETNCKGFK